MISKLTELAHELVAKVKGGIKAIVDAVKGEIDKLRKWIAG